MFAFSLINDFTGFALRVLGEELLAAAIARINERFVDKFLEGGFVDRSAGSLRCKRGARDSGHGLRFSDGFLNPIFWQPPTHKEPKASGLREGNPWGSVRIEFFQTWCKCSYGANISCKNVTKVTQIL